METHLNGIGLVRIDAAGWVIWGEGIKAPYSTGSCWRPLSIAYFHSLLLLFWFIGPCLWLIHVSTDVDPVLFILDLDMKYTLRWYLYVCILCGLLSCDRSLVCKKCWLCLCTTFTLLLMIHGSKCSCTVSCRYYPKLFFSDADTMPFMRAIHACIPSGKMTIFCLYCKICHFLHISIFPHR